MNIEAILIAAASLSGVIALIGLGVGVRGPTLLDRLIGLDLFTIALVFNVICLAIIESDAHRMEFILALTGLGFLTIVFFFYFLTRDPEIEAAPDADIASGLEKDAGEGAAKETRPSNASSAAELGADEEARRDGSRREHTLQSKLTGAQEKEPTP